MRCTNDWSTTTSIVVLLQSCIGPDFVQNTENSYFACIWPVTAAAVTVVVVAIAAAAAASAATKTVARGLSMSCTLISEQMTPQIFAPIATTTVACTRSPSLLLL